MPVAVKSRDLSPGDTAISATRGPCPAAGSRLVIFDLDGTLIDSLADIAAAANEALELLGLPTRPVENYRYLVGEGVPTLCKRLAGPESVYLGRLIELVRACYRARPMQRTRPYVGICDLLSRLRDGGRRLAILSNKPHELTVRIARAFWPAGTFDVVQGYVDEPRRKPDPTLALQICAACGVAPADARLVGDTPTDVETGRRAGIPVVGVTWGFRPRADLVTARADWVIDRPEEIWPA